MAEVGKNGALGQARQAGKVAVGGAPVPPTEAKTATRADELKLSGSAAQPPGAPQSVSEVAAKAQEAAKAAEAAKAQEASKADEAAKVQGPAEAEEPAEAPQAPEGKHQTPPMAEKPANWGIPGLRAFAGVGYLPTDVRWTTGATNPNLGYAGLDYDRTKAWAIGRTTQFGLNVHPTLLRTFGGEAEGTTTAQIQASAGVSHQAGPLTVSAGPGVLVDLTAIGKPGMPVATPFVGAQATYLAGKTVLGAEFFAPIGAFDYWQVRASASRPDSKWIPDLAVVANAQGVDRIEASKSWKNRQGLSAFVSVTENAPFSSNRHLSAGAGVRFSF